MDIKRYACLLLFISLILDCELTYAAKVDESTTPAKSKQYFSYYNERDNYAVIHLGGFWANQGVSQNISIEGLQGNYYTLDDNTQTNVLVGLGYFFKGLENSFSQASFGLDVFYLARTSVQGNILQEGVEPGLGYRYDIQNIPIYLASKYRIKSKNVPIDITFDFGIGPNILLTSNYSETPLNDYSLPDHAFGSHTNVTFSGTLGIGLQLSNLFKQFPLECGYRFFYLGNGNLTKNNMLLLDNLNTGNTYANALMCTVSV